VLADDTVITSSARALAAFEVGMVLRLIFTLPVEIETLTFDIPHLVECWPAMQRKLKCDSLPDHIRTASSDVLLADSTIIHEALRWGIRAAAPAGLMTGHLGYRVVLRELQQCMNDIVVPTGGLAFDGDHAAALTVMRFSNAGMSSSPNV
jgi:hypothetical protein